MNKKFIYIKEKVVLFNPKDINDSKINRTNHDLNEIKAKFLKDSGLGQQDIAEESTIILNDPAYKNWSSFPWKKQRAISDKIKMPSFNTSFKYYTYSKMGHLFDNSLDSISKAAFDKNIYQDFYPGIKMIVFNNNGVIVIDNGYGSTFEKRYIGNGMAKLIRNGIRLFNRYEPFFYGGFGEGIRISNCKLYCFGSGAVAAMDLNNELFNIKPEQPPRDHIYRTEKNTHRAAIVAGIGGGLACSLLSYLWHALGL